MPVYIKMNIEGVGECVRRINNVSKVVGNLKPAWKKIGEDFRRTEERVFNGQGAYGSRPSWKPLTPRYKEWKDNVYPGKPILQLSGNLKESLTRKSPNHIEIITRNSITLGSKDPKFKWHQKGTDSGLPARPPITFTKYQGDKWAKIIKDEILKGIKKA